MVRVCTIDIYVRSIAHKMQQLFAELLAVATAQRYVYLLSDLVTKELKEERREIEKKLGTNFWHIFRFPHS